MKQSSRLTYFIVYYILCNLKCPASIKRNTKQVSYENINAKHLVKYKVQSIS